VRPAFKYLPPEAPKSDPAAVRGEGEAELLGKLLEVQEEVKEVVLGSAWRLSYHHRQTPERRQQTTGSGLALIADTTKPPWCWICQLTIQPPGGGLVGGTGWLVGPKTIITAGHNVYMRSLAKWADTITVTPGRNEAGQPIAPFGSLTLDRGFFSVDPWIKAGDVANDYGAILLPAPFANMPGDFDYKAFSDPELSGLLITMSGYPGEAAYKPYARQFGAQAFLGLLDSDRLAYAVNTADGQSGGPVWVTLQGKRIAVGIHNYEDEGQGLAKSTRITNQVAKDIKDWLTMSGST
jgi:V8-like Glu-specific endopeptidase